MNPKFYLKNGELSAYSFLCGYIQRETFKGDIQLDLLQDGCYHVKCYDFENHGRLVWEDFTSLTEARAFWRRCRRILSKGGRI